MKSRDLVIGISARLVFLLIVALICSNPVQELTSEIIHEAVPEEQYEVITQRFRPYTS